MAQSADEGIDFQLISVPHHCHKADKYLSRVTTLAQTMGSDTFRRQDCFFCVFCLQMEHVCYGSSSMVFRFFLHIWRHLHDFFMPFFKIAVLHKIRCV